MAGLLPVDEALARVLAGAEPLPEEWIAVGDCDGRVLTRDLVAGRSQPPEDVSSMDGYAVRAADLPGRLAVIGESAAGRGFAGQMAAGEAVRIFTGAGVPVGADAVVMQEDAAREGDRVLIAGTARPGQFIRRRGLDFTEGLTGLAAGTLMNPRRLALAAAMNHAIVPVHGRPRVAILSTGDELVEPGTVPGPGQIVSSNALAIAAVVRRAGGEPTLLGISPDRLDATLERVRFARQSGHHVLVTSGGASVGEYDLMRDVIAAEGAEPGFWKIAMRPGKPLMMADLGAMRLLGLPGNPVASFVCSMLFLRPLLLRLAGRGDSAEEPEEAVLGADVPANDLRADHLRASLAQRDGRLVATPFPVQDSSMIRVLAEAEALILRAPHAPAVAAGSPCRILRLDR
ncbi:gephyrin-like molybdotransferase Glp [Phreatobacter cathodiphilus]|uniref:Molybdopterin molybdenumtransferase n=1 Tax=Phreatobacter cathodiphilus TaxID=1868589 RepID=A0A2S0NAC7_9HYPH|nr:gephyrin-like molybdotransferase Glp [Phreatobacter cathodiphilus]AVO44967.1 molybdopterin molybdenumtransferase MoeA [Phreatobacter cathodiphilus]